MWDFLRFCRRQLALLVSQQSTETDISRKAPKLERELGGSDLSMNKTSLDDS